ncbi:MAG: hypothetical protein K9M98_15485 [Cephaloticoccus sp.]|nr:hypothetical protein [Cephaloticoccus sp.]MCF7761903.1 hypothetical protein [Cephaloticoccus sp.]
MSDSTAARPASLISILAIMCCLALFLLLVYLAYLPNQTGPFIGDGIRTPAERKLKLAELRANEAKQAHSYAWIDQQAGQVQLPIERAMELTVQRYQSK